MLITGGTQGVGAATAKLAASAGAKVAVTARSEGPGHELIAEIQEEGGEAGFFKQDVTSEEDWRSVVRSVVDTFGGLHVLVNNAGAHIQKAFLDTSMDEFDRLLAINLRGVFVGIQHAVPVIRETVKDGTAGSIVNVSSTAALKPTAGESAYSATKAALQILSRSLAREFGELGYNIRVNTVNPGIIRTPMFERSVDQMLEDGRFNSREELESMLLADYPLQRFAMPEDVARTIVFLASEDANYITGATYPVDGGETA